MQSFLFDSFIWDGQSRETWIQTSYSKNLWKRSSLLNSLWTSKRDKYWANSTLFPSTSRAGPNWSVGRESASNLTFNCQLLRIIEYINLHHVADARYLTQISQHNMNSLDLAHQWWIPGIVSGIHLCTYSCTGHGVGCCHSVSLSYIDLSLLPNDFPLFTFLGGSSHHLLESLHPFISILRGSGL